MKPKTPTKLFGTDGIRGKASKFPLDSGTVRIIGASLARHLAEKTDGRSPYIIIGRDTRESGPRIESALAEGARGLGAKVASAGVITTPGVAFLTGDLQADAGVVISASHNPFEDNGIKVFDPSGRKLDRHTEAKIEADIAAGEFAKTSGFTTAEPDSSDEGDELRGRYLDYLQHRVAQDLSLEGSVIVADCANGAASDLAPDLLTRLGARVIAINNQPNGRNINLNCGSLHIEQLQSQVVSERAALGVAFDGDADRALFVDAQGNFVDGDATMWVLAKHLNSCGRLAGSLVVSTLMTNLGLEVALKAEGIKLTRTDVGDKYVLDELLRSHAVLGGEQSGHIIFPEISLAGDGLITAIKLLAVMRDERKSLSDLVHGFTRYPQVLVNVRVREKLPFDSVPAVAGKAKEIERELGDRGRLLLRYSGTEPLARVMIEGQNEDQVRALADQLAATIEKEMGESTPAG